MNYDISESVSQGSSGEETAENRRIHEIADELYRRCQLYEAQLRDGQGDVNRLEIEQRVAEQYAKEADVLNVAMFGMTAKQWREANPDLKGNIRDYATINELICLSNMENINAVLINDGMPQGKRLVKLNQIAIQQMQVLEDNESRKLLK